MTGVVRDVNVCLFSFKASERGRQVLTKGERQANASVTSQNHVNTIGIEQVLCY